jgi:hypothetical protein
MADPLDRPLRKLIAETDDAVVAGWLRRLRDGEGSSVAPRRRRPPPDVYDALQGAESDALNPTQKKK